MKFMTALTAAVAVSMLVAGAAGAQGASPKPRVACAADIQKFCPTAAPGKESMHCMKAHLADASPGCQSAVAAAKAAHAQKKAAAAAAAAATPAPAAPSAPQ